MKSPAARVACLVLAAASSPVAGHWDRITEVGGDQPTPFVAPRLSVVAGVADGRGLAILGQRGFVRMQAPGAPAEVMPFAAEDLRRWQMGRLQRTADGGLGGIDAAGCRGGGLAADGAWRWSSPAFAATLSWCRIAQLDDGGLVAAGFDGMGHVVATRMGGHGQVVWRRSWPVGNGMGGLALGAGAAEAGIAVATVGVDGSLLRVSADGELSWSRPLALPGLVTVQLAVDGSGGARLMHASGGGDVREITYGSSGTPAPSLLPLTAATVRQFAYTRDGTLLVIVHAQSTTELLAWRDGVLRWRSPVHGTTCAGGCVIEPDVASDIVVHAVGSNQMVIVARYDRASGALRGNHFRPGADGRRYTVVILGDVGADRLAYAYSAPPITAGAGAAWRDGLTVLDASGAVVEDIDLPQVTTPPAPATATVLADGAVVIAHETGPDGWRVERFDADDTPRWSLPAGTTTGNWIWQYTPAPIGLPGTCGDRGVCFVDGAHLHAVRQEDGTTLWRASLTPTSRIETSSWLGGTSVIALTSTSSGFPRPGPPNPYTTSQHVHVYDGLGDLPASPRIDGWFPLLGVDHSDHSLLVAGRVGTGLSRWQPPAQPVPLSANLEASLLHPQYPGTTAAGAQGVIALLASRNVPPLAHEYLLIGIQGNQRAWTQSLLMLPDAPGDRFVRGQQVLVADDGDFLAYLEIGRAFPGTPAIDADIVLVRSGPQGDLRWRRSFSPAPFVDGSIQLAGDRLLLAARRPHGLHTMLMAIDAEAGEVLRVEDPACPRGACGLGPLRLLDDGRIRAVGAGQASSAPYPILTRNDFFAPVADFGPMDLEGAWYAPAQTGQGFTARLFPHADGQQVFMPWFTFDRADIAGTAALRWYALQGVLATDPAAPRVLTITERLGGVFAAGPVADQRVVGEARLAFQACDRLLLSYRFDQGEHAGAEGAIPLRALLPATSDCQQPDGTLRPRQVALDPALSGHWYDPAHSGQGLELFRAAPGAMQDGFLYGAWFTFDPGAPAGESADQHWFTLQGQDVQPNGDIRTTLVQTLGGRQDAAPAGSTFRVGQATLSPGADCGQLHLTFAFDDHIDAGAFRGRSGTLALRRLGPCPPPAPPPR